MSKSRKGSGDEAESPALPRLPPGRHGLSREYVTKNQQERLAAGMIASIAEHGYHDTTISHVSAAAGVSRRTFYGYFSSKEESYLDTYELIVTHLCSAAREGAEAEAQWSGMAVGRLRGALEFFSANPDLARYVLISPRRAGEELLGRYAKGLKEAADELTDGIPDEVERPASAVEQALVAGLARLIAIEVEGGRGEELTEMLPELTHLFLTPYLGQKKANRIAAAEE